MWFCPFLPTVVAAKAVPFAFITYPSGSVFELHRLQAGECGSSLFLPTVAAEELPLVLSATGIAFPSLYVLLQIGGQLEGLVFQQRAAAALVLEPVRSTVLAAITRKEISTGVLLLEMPLAAGLAHALSFLAWAFAWLVAEDLALCDSKTLPAMPLLSKQQL